MTWHIDLATATEYSERRTEPTTSASVEAHLVGCEHCRSMVNDRADTMLLESIWSSIDDVLDTPRLGWIERALVRVGCNIATARIVAATTRARVAYLMVVVCSIAMALLSSSSTQSDELFTGFLLIAPFGPLIATAGAFGRWVDPAHSVLRTVPTSTWRMLLIRCASALVPALALTALATPWIADRGWMAVAWLLPALALSLSVIALSTWISVELATGAVAAVWLLIPVVSRVSATQILDAFATSVQLWAVVVVVVASGVMVLRHSQLEYGRT